MSLQGVELKPDMPTKLMDDDMSWRLRQSAASVKAAQSNLPRKRLFEENESQDEDPFNISTPSKPPSKAAKKSPLHLRPMTDHVQYIINYSCQMDTKAYDARNYLAVLRWNTIVTSGYSGVQQKLTSAFMEIVHAVFNKADVYL